MTAARARLHVALEDLGWAAAMTAACSVVLGIAWGCSFLVDPVAHWSMP